MPSQQINRLLGNTTMALHDGREPQWLPAVPWTRGSANHKMEAASVAVRAYRSEDAIQQALDRLATQRKTGHQCIGGREFLTDSHAPIWYRAMASLYLTALELDHDKLIDACHHWWGCELWAREHLTVPRGPLKGALVSACGRFKRGHNDNRDYCLGVIDGGGPEPPERYIKNALRWQQSYAITLVRRIDRMGGWEGLRAVKPKPPGRFVVEKYTDGHVTIADGLDAKNPRVVWVEYSSGNIIPGGPYDLGGAVGREELRP